MVDDGQFEKYYFQHAFFPGEFCEEIYNMNPKTHNRSGYQKSILWDDLSLCDNNPETGDKSGYYCINDKNWIYCNMTAVRGGREGGARGAPAPVK